jgi:uncharacterized protein YfkK (UPF0435 family)
MKDLIIDKDNYLPKGVLHIDLDSGFKDFINNKIVAIRGMNLVAKRYKNSELNIASYENIRYIKTLIQNNKDFSLNEKQSGSKLKSKEKESNPSVLGTSTLKKEKSGRETSKS